MAAVVANKVKRARSSRVRGDSVHRRPIQIEIDRHGRIKRKEETESEDETNLKIPPNSNNGGRSPSTQDDKRAASINGDDNEAVLRKKKMDQLQGGEEGVYRNNSSANVVLYVGLGMVSIGLVITFVGLGDKGFKTLELKLIGPSLVGCGVFFALLRILFCTVPSCFKSCFACCKRDKDDKQKLLNKSAVNGKQQQPSQQQQQPPVRGGPINGSNRRIGPSPSAAPSHPNFIHNSDSEDTEFQQKVIRSTAVIAPPVAAGNETGFSISNTSSSRSKKRKPVSYDEYSTTSSDEANSPRTTMNVTTIPRLPSLNGGDANNLKSGDIVLNASSL